MVNTPRSESQGGCALVAGLIPFLILTVGVIAFAIRAGDDSVPPDPMMPVSDRSVSLGALIRGEPVVVRSYDPAEEFSLTRLVQTTEGMNKRLRFEWSRSGPYEPGPFETVVSTYCELWYLEDGEYFRTTADRGCSQRANPRAVEFVIPLAALPTLLTLNANDWAGRNTFQFER